tara:strand:- start:29355 stop:30212 length:858 start_codon:yes stop_codon:yes gene_type:complete
MSKERYLFYDNLVKGSGLGHALCCYAHGLKLAQSLDLKFMPPQLELGFGLSQPPTGYVGLIEDFLGLPDVSTARLFIETHFPDSIKREKYTYAQHPAIPLKAFSQDFKEFLRDSFKQSRLPLPDRMFPQVLNIAISIRRGDLLLGNKLMSDEFRKRIRSDQFYVRAIKRILKTYKPKDYFLHLYSDGSRKNGDYINEEGKPTDLKILLKEHHGKFNYYPSKEDALRTLTQFQNCIYADVFLGSISGFSELICTYRGDRPSYLPTHHSLVDFEKWLDERPPNPYYD